MTVMTYYGPADIARSFATVRNNTIQIAEEIPEEKYDFKASPDSRSIRRPASITICTAKRS